MCCFAANLAPSGLLYRILQGSLPLLEGLVLVLLPVTPEDPRRDRLVAVNSPTALSLRFAADLAASHVVFLRVLGHTSTPKQRSHTKFLHSHLTNSLSAASLLHINLAQSVSHLHINQSYKPSQTPILLVLNYESDTIRLHIQLSTNETLKAPKYSVALKAAN